MSSACCDVGIIGAGVMGLNLALNIAEKGFEVALYNRTLSKIIDFVAQQPPELAAKLHTYPSYEAFAKALKVPRKCLILVPAGRVTDGVIEALCNVLEPQDILVDTGNAHFKEQDRRARELEAKGFRFLGMGISGGEEGARKGPAFFPGGSLSVWNEIKPIVEAAAAKASDGKPCVTMNGSGGAGSCVKMYHNSGEYAILQLWGEVFEILKTMGKSNMEIATILKDFKARENGLLNSYMLDISISVCEAVDEPVNPTVELTNQVMDKVGSKGTGLWSAQEALDVGVPVPSLNNAVIARQFSMIKDQRVTLSHTPFAKAVNVDHLAAAACVPESVTPDALYHAVKLSIIACYAQMFQALRALDAIYKFGLNFPKIIATFRAGCILQGYLLQPMTRAFEQDPNIPNLMCAFHEDYARGIKPFREALGALTAHTAIALPVFTASLTYIQAMPRSTLLYGQMVALQRDVFGRHGFERTDDPTPGALHNHNWPEMQ